MVPTYLIWKRYGMVPHMYNMIFSGQPIWSPTCTYGPPIWLLWSSYLIWNRYLMVPPYLIWNRYCMVPPHVWYDFFRPAHMVPPHIQYVFFFRPAWKESTACPKYDFWWSPLTLYVTGIVWSPHMYVWSLPHVTCLHVLYDLWSPWNMTLMVPPCLIWNWYLMVPHRAYVSYGPPIPLTG